MTKPKLGSGLRLENRAPNSSSNQVFLCFLIAFKITAFQLKTVFFSAKASRLWSDKPREDALPNSANVSKDARVRVLEGACSSPAAGLAGTEGTSTVDSNLTVTSSWAEARSTPGDTSPRHNIESDLSPSTDLSSTQDQQRAGKNNGTAGGLGKREAVLQPIGQIPDSSQLQDVPASKQDTQNEEKNSGIASGPGKDEATPIPSPPNESPRDYSKLSKSNNG